MAPVFKMSSNGFLHIDLKRQFPIFFQFQLDSEASRTQTKEMNKHGHSVSFACVL